MGKSFLLEAKSHQHKLLREGWLAGGSRPAEGSSWSKGTWPKAAMLWPIQEASQHLLAGVSQAALLELLVLPSTLKFSAQPAI